MSAYSDLYRRIQSAEALPAFSPETLAEHFGLPQDCFAASQDDPDLVLCTRRHADRSAEGYLLKGTFFFRRTRRIVRAYPKILYGRQRQPGMPFAVQAEVELLSCLASGGILFEEKLDGVNIRVYAREGSIRFATRQRHDGSNPLGLQPWGEIARRVLQARYPGALALAHEGCVPVFELLSPEFAGAIRYSEEDAVLIDVIRSDHRFADRAEKEELAARHGLRAARVVSRVDGAQPAHEFHKALRGLEHYAHELGIEGMVAKASRALADGGRGDQVFLKVKTEELRRLHRSVNLPDRILRATIGKVADGLGTPDLADVAAVVDLVAEDLEEDAETRVGPELRERIDHLYRAWLDRD